MIQAAEFLNYLKFKEITFLSGVPCSILKPIFEKVLSDDNFKYVPAVRENVALGLASGACLAGKKSCILMQNSGLGNIINALTSFNLIYKIPVLMLISWRGYEGKDAPEHIIIGQKMIPLLELIEIPYRILDFDFKQDVDWAIQKMDLESIPVSLILKNGVIN
jgi:phosphonopyruvate decarboxylase